jgi:hypothetical protein
LCPRTGWRQGTHGTAPSGTGNTCAVGSWSFQIAKKFSYNLQQKLRGTSFLEVKKVKKYALKGLSHEMDLAFDDMYGLF